MSFSDFVTNTGLIAIVSLVAVVIYFYLVFRKELTSNTVTKNPADYPDPSEAITSKGGFVISWIIFLCAVVLLVTHSQTGLTVSCIGVFIAFVTLLTAGRDALDLLKKSRLQNPSVLCRTVCRRRRSGKDRNPYAAGWLYRKCQWR
ncbi:MAG: SLC13 family permease [Blautia sp.]